MFLAAAAAAGLLTWARIVVPESPSAVLEIWPNNAQAVTKKADELYRSPSPQPREMLALSHKLLIAFPLSETPLVLAGAAAAAEARSTDAVEIFKAARSRQPRNIPALTWITADDIRNEDFDLALRNLETLKRLNPGAEDVYVSTSASIAETPGGRDAFREAVKSKNSLALRALKELNQGSEDFGLLLDLNAYNPAGAGVVIDRLLKARGAETAFIAWLSMLPPTEARSLQWPYDGAFVGMSAPPPFSWSISREAELQEAGGLYVSYAGTTAQKPVFARQTMLIGQGVYTLQAEMEGETSDEGAHFEWSISCLESQLQIALLVVETLAPTIQTKATTFEVPAGCSAQEILLSGKPGIFPVRARTIVRQVKIRPAETPQ